MTKTRYTITTKGSITTVLRKPGSRKLPRSTGFSSPPFEKIKHLFVRPPTAAPKSKRKKKR